MVEEAAEEVAAEVADGRAALGAALLTTEQVGRRPSVLRAVLIGFGRAVRETRERSVLSPTSDDL